MNTRTNIVLDDQLVAQAMERARVTTKKAAVEAALERRGWKTFEDAQLALSAQITSAHKPARKSSTPRAPAKAKALAKPTATMGRTRRKVALQGVA